MECYVKLQNVLSFHERRSVVNKEQLKGNFSISYSIYLKDTHTQRLLEKFLRLFYHEIQVLSHQLLVNQLVTFIAVLQYSVPKTFNV